MLLRFGDCGCLDAGGVHCGERTRTTAAERPVLSGSLVVRGFISGRGGIGEIGEGVGQLLFLLRCEVGDGSEDALNGRVLVLVLAEFAAFALGFVFPVKLAPFLGVPDQLLTVLDALGKGFALLRVLSVEAAGIHSLFHTLGLMLAVELPAFVRIALQFLAVFHAFGKGAGFGGVFRIKPAGVHSFLGFFVHRFLFLRLLVACCRGIGQIGEGVRQFFDVLGVEFGGQFTDELTDFLRLVLVFGDIHDFASHGVDLVQVDDGLRKLHFLLFDVRVVVLRAPEPFLKRAHKRSFFR